jgi:cytoskeletal protein CcmA (bactofilin family)
MALFGKSDERPGRFDDVIEPAPPVARDPRNTGEPADVQAHFGRGSRIEGKLHFDGSVRIDGQVQGEVEAKDTVIVGESADVVAQILAGTIVIKGKVTGDVTARKRVELRAPGRLLGNIVTPSLVIQEGVVFEGHCSMAQADAGAERAEKDKKVAIFPKEDRSGVRIASEAAK